MSAKNIVTIESATRFSQCQLWKAQRDYYSRYGIEAWASEVPFYITSSVFIGHKYAHMVVRFLQDWFKQYPDKLTQPVTILELGVGPGQFSFYVLKNLTELLKHFGLEHVQVRYIMSDLSENKFDFWRNHHALKPYVDAGILDFAVFDFENDTVVNTVINKQVLDSGLENPLIVFANYVFDSVSTDIFTVTNAQLQESVVDLSTNVNNVQDGAIKNWKKVKFSHHQRSIDASYYDDADLNGVLNSYKNSLIDTNFLFPNGALQGLQRLRALSNNKLLLISSDKGYTSLEELDNLDYPELDFHGSFSVMVNYHAIAEFFKQSGGAAVLQPQREGIVTGLFTSGFDLQKFPNLSYAANEAIQRFTPADYFINYEYVTDNLQHCSLQLLTSQLCLSRWDPFYYSQVSERLNDLLEDADAEVISYLISHVPELWSNFYYMPEGDDVAFDIGVFLHEQDRFQEACQYYQYSLDMYGENFAVIYNLAFCQYYIGEKQAALENFKRALTFKPKSHETKQWVTKVVKEL